MNLKDFENLRKKTKEEQKEPESLRKAKRDRLSRVCSNCKNLSKNCSFIYKSIGMKKGKVRKDESPTYVIWCAKKEIK